MIKAPVRKNAKLRFWLWPVRLIGKFWKSPVSPGLWLVNKFCQNVLDINNDIPWMCILLRGLQVRLQLEKMYGYLSQLVVVVIFRALTAL